jgi:hypothetical protein
MEEFAGFSSAEVELIEFGERISLKRFFIAVALEVLAP